MGSKSRCGRRKRSRGGGGKGGGETDGIPRALGLLPVRTGQVMKVVPVWRHTPLYRECLEERTRVEIDR